jgi:hypothetical protein
MFPKKNPARRSVPPVGRFVEVDPSTVVLAVKLSIL